MGLPSSQPDHARDRAHADCQPDRGEAAPRLRAVRWFAGFLTCLVAAQAWAEPIRLATWHADFSRKGPGLLLRDLLDDRDAALTEAVRQIATLAPDILLLTTFDYDRDGVALAALAERLAAAGTPYPVRHAALPNGGMPTGRDLDGDGMTGGPRDAQGYGWFSGDNGLAILSRLDITASRSFSDRLWSETPDTAMTPEDRAHDVQRLSSSAHWVLTFDAPGGPIDVGAFAATPPLFDGPEDRNGRRNRDEVAFWHHYLDGRITGTPTRDRFVLMGNANLDPDRGEGRRDAIAALLGHPDIADPLPGLPTVSFASAGDMRVSYVLPSRDLRVTQAGVADPGARTGPHRLVWVDIALP